MCVSPLHIRNKKIDFDSNFDKEFLDVPCGHCIECRNARRREWEFRAWYEHLQTQSVGGVTYFWTLTYDENNVPFIDYNGKRYRHFYKPDFQKFKHALDMHLRRNYGFKLRYMCTSEFGKKRTKRPHYHVLFFLDKFIPYNEFSALISKYWQYGMTKAGQHFGMVDSINAIRYVAKYVCKDSSYQILLPNFILELVPENERNNLKQFVLTSQKFGLYALQTLTPSQLLSGTSTLPNKSNSSISDYVLPTYLLRKLYYDVKKNSNGTNSYVLNDFGRKRKVALLDKLIDDSENRYKCAYLNIPNYIREVGTDFVDNLLGLDYETNDYKNIVDLYLENVGSFKDIAVFKNVYKGRPIPCTFIPQSYKKDFIYFISKRDNTIDNPLGSPSVGCFDNLNINRTFVIVSTFLDRVSQFVAWKTYLRNVANYNCLQYQRVNCGKYEDLQLLKEPTFEEYLKKNYLWD